jgi:hypothetical protein
MDTNNQRRHPFAGLLVMCLAAGGCYEPPAVPDAGTNELECEPNQGAAEPFELAVGFESADSEFVELSDHDSMEFVLGVQGLYMLAAKFRAYVSFPDDELCLDCVASVGPAGSFAGVEQSGFVPYSKFSTDSFGTSWNLILGSGPDLVSSLDGADVVLSISCEGHGFSGELERTIHLLAPPESQ